MMRKRTRTSLVAGATAALVLGASLGAWALWSAGTQTSVPTFSIGAVSFGARPGANPADPPAAFSADGGAVTVTLPGETVLSVLDQTGVNPAPTIWRFTATGGALGIAGIDYDVNVVSQGTGGSAHPLADGIAKEGTLLKGSTLKIYRAAAGGDCSAIPATPAPAEGETPRNVYLFDNTDVQLQAAGAGASGVLTEQQWCAALAWNQAPDGEYVNGAQAVATGANGATLGATDEWRTAVGDQPSLPTLGTYRNRADADGIASDSSEVHANTTWEVEVYPDPSDEPDIIISLDPIVTNQNPAVDPRD